MEYLVICLVTFIISVMALFSGFGLGTVLMPVFAIFFPLTIAIAATAVVHLANNLFKLALVGKFAKRDVVIKFGIPAAIAAALGAYLLGFFAKWPPLFSYQFFSWKLTFTFIGIIIGVIVILSSLFELIPKLSQLNPEFDS